MLGMLWDKVVGIGPLGRLPIATCPETHSFRQCRGVGRPAWPMRSVFCLSRVRVKLAVISLRTGQGQHAGLVCFPLGWGHDLSSCREVTSRPMRSLELFFLLPAFVWFYIIIMSLTSKSVPVFAG